jgi:hypothetical protein
MNSNRLKASPCRRSSVSGVDVEADGVPYGVDAVRLITDPYGDSGRSNNGFEGTDACFTCFDGSGLIQRRRRRRSRLKRGRNQSGTVQKAQRSPERLPIANRSSYACLDRLYGSREASTGSVAALNVTESRGD